MSSMFRALVLSGLVGLVVRGEGGGGRFWKPAEGQLRMLSETLVVVDFGPGFRLQLEDGDDDVRLALGGPEGRQVTWSSRVAFPGGMGEFCVREQPGEGRESDPSVWLNSLALTGGGPIPVGRADVGAWRFWNLQWDMHGCGIAGLFRSELLVGQHLPSGTWAARADFGTGFVRFPAGVEPHPAFHFDLAFRTSNNCWVREPWIFKLRKGRAAVVVGSRSYRWFGGTTVADSPRKARHWGHQEVAWHVASATREGGVAEAFGESPRPEGDFEGLRPVSGRMPFRWKSMVVAAGKDGRRRFLDVSQALALVKKGGWDVVLERRGEQTTATWIVEHDRAFPHSTPR